MKFDVPHKKLILDLALFYKTNGYTANDPEGCKKMDRICESYSNGLISASEAIASMADIEHYWER